MSTPGLKCLKEHHDSFKNRCIEETSAYRAAILAIPQDVTNCRIENFKDCPPEIKQKELEILCPPRKKELDCWMQEPISITCENQKGFIMAKKNQEQEGFQSECGDFLKSASSDIRPQGFTFMMPWTLLLFFFV